MIKRINLFKKLQVATSPVKSVNEVIQEIHTSFYTEVDRLLEEAKVSKSLDTNKQELIDKCERLKKLGFTNAGETKEGSAEIVRLEQLKQQNLEKASLVRAIDYFSVKYPNYKFITEDSVRTICEKYSLIYGTVDKYIGTVPDKNLKHIEDFKISDEDKCYIREISGMYSSDKQYISYPTYISYKKGESPHYRSPHFFHWEYQSPLEIAAPIKDFDTKNMEVKGFKLSKMEIPDPVVLQPVYFESKKHYLIITAWGEEASDEIVINQKMN